MDDTNKTPAVQPTPQTPDQNGAQQPPDYVVDSATDADAIRTVSPRLISPLFRVGYLILGILCLVWGLLLLPLEGRPTLLSGAFLFVGAFVLALRLIAPRRVVQRQLRVLRESYGGDSVPCRLVFWPEGLVVNNLTSGGHVNLRYDTFRRMIRYKGYLILITAAKQMTLLTPADLEGHPGLPDYLKAKCPDAKRKGF